MTRSRLIAGLLLVLSLVGCVPRTDDNPVTYHNNTPSQALLAASLQAAEIKGRCFYVENTRSMEPLLYGGDYIVVDTQLPFDQLKARQVITYRAGWATASAPPVTHRTWDKTPTGWTVKGDNSTGVELGMWRVDEGDYIGKVVAIYAVSH